MHFDPYESKEAKKRRITSNIAMVFIGVMLIVGILMLIFRDVSNPKYDFEHFKAEPISVAQAIEGDNEFKKLMDFAQSSNKPMLNDSFKKDYPLSSALLNMESKIYDSGKPAVSISGGYIALAQCVISNAVDCRDLSVLLIKLEKTEATDSVYIKLSDITEYTVRYNTRDNSVPLTFLPNDQGTHINLYKFSMALTEESLTESKYSLYLNHEFDAERAKARLYHQIVLDPINNSYHSPKIEKMSGSTLIYIDAVKATADKNGANRAKYQINMSDKTFYLLDSIEFNYKLESIENATLAFEFN